MGAGLWDGYRTRVQRVIVNEKGTLFHNAGYDVWWIQNLHLRSTGWLLQQADSYRFQRILPASPHIDEERGPMTSESRQRQENGDSINLLPSLQDTAPVQRARMTMMSKRRDREWARLTESSRTRTRKGVGIYLFCWVNTAGGKRRVRLLIIFIVARSGDGQLETTMSTVEEKNKLSAVPSSTNLRMRKEEISCIYGEWERWWDSCPFLNASLYLTYTSIIPIFNRVRMPTRTWTVVGVLTIFVGGDGRKSKCCNDYNQHNGRRERELGWLAIHPVVNDHNQGSRTNLRWRAVHRLFYLGESHTTNSIETTSARAMT